RATGGCGRGGRFADAGGVGGGPSEPAGRSGGDPRQPARWHRPRLPAGATSLSGQGPAGNLSESAAGATAGGNGLSPLDLVRAPRLGRPLSRPVVRRLGRLQLEGS